MPNEFTKTTAGFAFASGLLWIVAAGMFLLGEQVTDDWGTVAYLAWAAVVALAGAFLTVAAAGLRQLHPLRQGWALAGIGILVVGVALGLVVTWAIPLWMAVEGLGLLVLVVACRPITIASAAIGLAMPLGVVAFIILDALEVGAVDQYGDYPIAWQAALAIGAVTLAAGLFGLRRQLRPSMSTSRSGTAVSA